MQSSILDEAF